MANDKREAYGPTTEKVIREDYDTLAKIVEQFEKVGYHDDIGHRLANNVALLALKRHATATAEGIPQADGWVAIKSIADLPTVNGRYVTQEWSGILRIQDYDSHRRKLWFSSVLAYLPKPIQPYQRPSREGDSNER